MRPRVIPFLLLGAATACDGFESGRLQRLEQEVRELRAEHAAAPEDVAEAMAPLRNAMDLLLQRSDVERARWTALAQEIGQLATLVHGVVDETRRTELEALRARIDELERRTKEQASAQTEERELLLRALDATAKKLEAFLRRVEPRKGAVAPALPDSGLWVSLRDPRVAWGLALTALLGTVVLALARRPRRGPRALPLDPPDAFVDAPAPLEDAVSVREGGPIALRVDVRTHDLDAAWHRVALWVADEPRILEQPPPRVERHGGALRVCVFVPSEMPLAERASLSAEITLRGRGESHADRRSA